MHQPKSCTDKYLAALKPAATRHYVLNGAPRCSTLWVFPPVPPGPGALRPKAIKPLCPKSTLMSSFREESCFDPNVFEVRVVISRTRESRGPSEPNQPAAGEVTGVLRSESTATYRRSSSATIWNREAVRQPPALGRKR